MRPGRGFGALPPAWRRDIAASGGFAAARQGVAHGFSSATGRAARSRVKRFPVRLQIVGRAGLWRLQLKRGRKLLETLGRCSRRGGWVWTAPLHDRSLAASIPLVARRQGLNLGALS